MPLTGEARKAYARKHYLENKDKYAGSSKAARERKYALLDEIKNKPCMDCGNSFPPECMDFDHTSDDKVGNVVDLLQNSSWSAVLEEIKKCDLVCANCHRIRTKARVRTRKL